MSLFLTKRHSQDINNFEIILFSVCYALMSFNIMFAFFLPWLDLVILLPILALQIDKIVLGNKSIGFIIALFISMISNYYISYMVVISIVMYFGFRLIEERVKPAEQLKRYCSLAIHGLLAFGLSAFVIIPVLCDLNRGKFTEVLDNSSNLFIKNTLFDVLRSFIPLSYSSLDENASPNLFCGSIVTILAVVFFFFGKKNDLKARVAGVVITLFYFASFIFGPLDRMWHGFREPVKICPRYTFTFAFFMICFAVRGLAVVKRISISLFFKRFLSSICLIYTFLELFFNCAFIQSKLATESRYTNRNEYNRYCDLMAELLEEVGKDADGEYSRVFKDFGYSLYGGALFGYDGLEFFTSSYNCALSEFLSDVGVQAYDAYISEVELTRPISSLFNMGYLISDSPQNDYYDQISEYNFHYLYRNECSLPLIFGTKMQSVENVPDFSDDPFENINTVFEDLSAMPDRQLFIKQDYTYAMSMAEQSDDSFVIDCSFEPDEDGCYWMYSELEINATDSGMVDYYLNGSISGTIREGKRNRCHDLGMLSSENQYDITYGSLLSNNGNIYLYRYDDESFKDVYEELNENGFKISYIGKNGIKAQGNMPSDGYIFISLPYEKGYKVYLDGERTDYSSYRGALMLVSADEGVHEIEIKFTPPGLTGGMIVSFLFVLLTAIYLKSNIIKKYLLNIRETLT